MRRHATTIATVVVLLALGIGGGLLIRGDRQSGQPPSAGVHVIDWYIGVYTRALNKTLTVDDRNTYEQRSTGLAKLILEGADTFGDHAAQTTLRRRKFFAFKETRPGVGAAVTFQDRTGACRRFQVIARPVNGRWRVYQLRLPDGRVDDGTIDVPPATRDTCTLAD